MFFGEQTLNQLPPHSMKYSYVKSILMTESSSSLLFTDPLTQILDSMTTSLMPYINNASIEPKLCIVGDLNMPNINWSDMCGTSLLTNSTCDILYDHNLSQINNLPSHALNDNILDVNLTNFPRSSLR